MKAETSAHEMVHAIVASEYQPVDDSITIVREAHAGRDAAFAITFELPDGRQRRGFIGLTRDSTDLWQSSGGFMGTVRETGPDDVFSTYGGWGDGGSKEHAVFGGWVTDSSAASVRLIDARSGDVLEDQVVNGVAIFMVEGGLPLRYARIELLDSTQRVLRADPAERSG